ncbi:BTB/POZ domain-containing protein At1g63850 [Silene latifolia]|uniref:BTB/POZ domain-containing protein At1g63850 n=1 Tax=Silene latifolia TaxID=37657 RepID=UPI003D776AFE
MAAATTTTITSSTSTSTKPKRRRFREITITTSTSESLPFSDSLNSPSPTRSLHSPMPSSPYPSNFTKFNSALTAGLLNPMSPPPNPTRSSPTLFEMMSTEPEPRSTPPRQLGFGLDRASLMEQRVGELLSNRSPGSRFNDPGSGDVRLTVTNKEGFSVGLSVHRDILCGNSKFFAGKLGGSSNSSSSSSNGSGTTSFKVEIVECEDVEVYVETLKLMYCRDLRRKLMREDVPKVLSILKVSAAIGFDAGVLSCLEYLEAAPWAEDDEEKVSSLLSELHLEGIGASEVLKRVSLDATSAIEENISENEQVLLKLLHVVLEGKDEKARREMKGLVSKMLRENANQNDLRKESLYSACDGCLNQLRHNFLRAAGPDLQDVGQIARQADNLYWILDILIERQIAEDFLKSWASQSEMAKAHSKIPPVHRFEISKVTARLFVGIGKGQLLASKDMRCLLLQTWLVPFYDDFGWMRRASKGLDRHLIEDGLSNTILTLPLTWQQEILLAWFDRFLNSGEDCPNLQRGFEVWWRRAFWKRNGHQPDHPGVRIPNPSSQIS